MGRFRANQIFHRLGEEACCFRCYSFRDFSIRLWLSSSRFRDPARRSARAARQSSARCTGGRRSFSLLPIFRQQWRRGVSTRTLYGLSTLCGFAALFRLAFCRSRVSRRILLSRSRPITFRCRLQIRGKRRRIDVANFWPGACTWFHFSTCRGSRRTRLKSERDRCDCLLDCCPGSKWHHLRDNLGANEKSLRAHTHSCCRRPAPKFWHVRPNVVLKHNGTCLLPPH